MNFKLKKVWIKNEKNELIDELQVRLFSDLHLEYDYSFKIPNIQKNQIIILAGDIHNNGRSKSLNEKLTAFFHDILSQGAIILFVAGNHDYWGTHIEKYNSLINQFERENENFYFLNDSSVFINDIEFLGGTLWTNFNKKDTRTYLEVQGHKDYGRTANTSNDYHKIKEKYEKDGRTIYTKLTSKTTYLRHIKTVKYLTERAGEHHTQFVVTHHAPSEIFVDKERWNKHKKNGYDYNINKYSYYSELEYLAEQFNYWASGHTHKYVNEYYKNTLFLSIPRGYIDKKNEKNSEVVNKFNPNLIIKIKVKK